MTHIKRRGVRFLSEPGVNSGLYERCEEFGRYITANGATVRETAAQFGVGKSTVHKDVTDKLRHVNAGLYHEVAEILRVNKAERHLRGGEATRIKYKLKKPDGE